MTKEYQVGQTFENFKLLAVNAENSQVSIVFNFPKGASSADYLNFLDTLATDYYYISSYSGYFKVTLDSHRYYRFVKSINELTLIIKNFIKLAREFGGQISVAPYGSDEGEYWYHLDEKNKITGRILVDPG